MVNRSPKTTSSSNIPIYGTCLSPTKSPASKTTTPISVPRSINTMSLLVNSNKSLPSTNNSINNIQRNTYVPQTHRPTSHQPKTHSTHTSQGHINLRCQNNINTAENSTRQSQDGAVRTTTTNQQKSSTHPTSITPQETSTGLVIGTPLLLRQFQDNCVKDDSAPTDSTTLFSAVTEARKLTSYERPSGNHVNHSLSSSIPSLAIGSPPPTTHSADRRIIAFLDLDDTLIPTVWIRSRFSEIRSASTAQRLMQSMTGELQNEAKCLIDEFRDDLGLYVTAAEEAILCRDLGLYREIRAEIDRLTGGLLVSAILRLLSLVANISIKSIIVTNARSAGWLKIFKWMFPEVSAHLAKLGIKILRTKPEEASGNSEPDMQKEPKKYFHFWMYAKQVEFEQLLMDVTEAKENSGKHPSMWDTANMADAATYMYQTTDKNVPEVPSVEAICVGDNEFEETAFLHVVNLHHRKVSRAAMVRCSQGLNPRTFRLQVLDMTKAIIAAFALRDGFPELSLHQHGHHHHHSGKLRGANTPMTSRHHSTSWKQQQTHRNLDSSSSDCTDDADSKVSNTGELVLQPDWFLCSPSNINMARYIHVRSHYLGDDHRSMNDQACAVGGRPFVKRFGSHVQVTLWSPSSNNSSGNTDSHWGGGGTANSDNSIVIQPINGSLHPSTTTEHEENTPSTIDSALSLSELTPDKIISSDKHIQDKTPTFSGLQVNVLSPETSNQGSPAPPSPHKSRTSRLVFALSEFFGRRSISH